MSGGPNAEGGPVTPVSAEVLAYMIQVNANRETLSELVDAMNACEQKMHDYTLDAVVAALGHEMAGIWVRLRVALDQLGIR